MIESDVADYLGQSHQTIRLQRYLTCRRKRFHPKNYSTIARWAHIHQLTDTGSSPVPGDRTHLVYLYIDRFQKNA
jgi:hypothetical protein